MKVDATLTSSSSMFIPPIAGNSDTAVDYSTSMPGKPGLQSSRLISAEYTTNLSKNLLKKLACLLKEVGLPDKLFPSKAIADLYDQVSRMILYMYNKHIFSLYISTYICIHIYIYLYTHIYIYVHTY